MYRTLVALLSLTLAACGSSNLKSAKSKALGMNGDAWPDGGGEARLLFSSPDCPTLDDRVVATLNGHPMKLVAPGGRAVLDDNKCDEVVWHFDGPLPSGDWDAVLHDDSDTLELVLTDALHTPPVTLPSTTVARGRDFQVNVDAADLAREKGSFSSVRVVAADGTTAELLTSQALVLPSTFPTGPAQLFAEFQLQPPASVTGDATATTSPLNLDAPAVEITVQ